MIDHLDRLEGTSLHIIREAFSRLKQVGLLWSVGKDSTTLLWLCRKAFYGAIPFPVIHIDTGRKFPEMYDFRDRLVREWGLQLLVARNERALAEDVSPERGHLECCNRLKTEALRQFTEAHPMQGLLLAIRRDEHGIRAKERVFSPRDDEFRWNYARQPAELWSLYGEQASGERHVRVHPLLHWTELDVWEYVRRERIPVVSLYFASKGQRFRSIGCAPCCRPVESTAATVDEIVEELRQTKVAERSGRAQDKEAEYVMQKLRSLGYM